MSTYEWEQGTIVIPARQYVAVRRAMIEKMRTHYDEMYQHALNFHVALCNKGRDVPIKKRAWNDWYGSLRFRSTRDYWGIGTSHDLDREHYIAKALFGVWSPHRGGPLPRKPRRAQFPRVTNKTRLFYCGCDATIAFYDDRHAVTWSVPENNHAAEHARKHKAAEVLFAELKKVKWAKGTGGTIVGNDEYNQDSSYAGGGANYVVAEYGP